MGCFLYFIYFFVYRLSAKKKTDRSIHEHYITSYIRAIFYINCDYNFNPCGIFEKMTSFSQILNQDSLARAHNLKKKYCQTGPNSHLGKWPADGRVAQEKYVGIGYSVYVT